MADDLYANAAATTDPETASYVSWGATACWDQAVFRNNACSLNSPEFHGSALEYAQTVFQGTYKC